ncbi:MAG: ribosome-associated translation inhibitor RaiA [Planctomycetota bacterium]
MQVNVSTRHGQLQNGDQELITEKVERLRRLLDRINAIDVTVDLQDKPIVEIVVSAERSDDIVASADATTVIAALDMAIPKVEHQLRRIKEKRTEHRKTDARVAATPPLPPETDD